ncbi:MAG: 3-keto-disaccharide hydrolase [Thalassotalea sp.]
MKHKLVTSTLSLLLVIAIAGCQNSQPDQTKQTINKHEWVSLFNGKNLDGWTAKFKGHPAGENYNNTFRVEDGLLTVSYDNWASFPKNKFGHLFTNQAYSNYRLRVEYRFVGEQVTNAKNYSWAYRNNGIMLHSPAAEYMELEQEFPMSGETQLLGGNGKDARTTGNFCSPSTNIIKAGKLITKHCVSSTSKTFHGDQWVWFEIEARADGSVKHFVNGELVFEYDELQVDPNDEYGKKWLAQGNPLKLTGGHFSLQAETHPTQFRTIEIKSLD